MVWVQIRSEHEDEQLREIENSDFKLTGKLGIRTTCFNPYRLVIPPEPRLDYALKTCESREGWLAFLVDEQDEDVILVFTDQTILLSRQERYLALEP